MSLSRPFDPVHADFPDEGNLMGVFDGDILVHLPAAERRFRPLLVTGDGPELENWIANQMVQDADHGTGALVCLDPGGRYANAFLQCLDKKDAKRVLWIDLDAPLGEGRSGGRVIPLNPCDPFNQHNERDFRVFQDRFRELLNELSGDARRVLDFALKAFALNRSHEADRAFTLSALLVFCADAAYRRYILSGLHPALLGNMPDAEAFRTAYPAIAAALRPIFAEPVWRATLGVQTSSALAMLPLSPIIVVTGEALNSEVLPASLWRHAFFRHLLHLMRREEARSGLHLYGFGMETLDDPGIDAVLSRNSKSVTTVTLARDAYGYVQQQPRLFYDQEIAFDADMGRMNGSIYARKTDDLLFFQPRERGGSFSLKLPPEIRKPSPALPGILGRNSPYRYGRKLLYPLLEIDQLFISCKRGEAIYTGLELPPPLACRGGSARVTGAQKKPRRKAPSAIVQNPFYRKTV